MVKQCRKGKKGKAAGGKSITGQRVFLAPPLVGLSLSLASLFFFSPLLFLPAPANKLHLRLCLLSSNPVNED